MYFPFFHKHINLIKGLGVFVAVIGLFKLTGFGGRIKKLDESFWQACPEPHRTVHQILP